MTRIAERIVVDKPQIGMARMTSRLGEEILKSPNLEIFYDNYYRDLTEFLVDCLSDPQVPLVLADDVVEYMYGREYLWEQKEIPPCLPPFPAVFIETTKPERLTSIDGSWGALFLRKEEVDSRQFIMPIGQTENVEWVVEMIVLWVDNERNILAYPLSFFFFFDSNGRIRWNSEGVIELAEDLALPPSLGVQRIKDDPEYEFTLASTLALAVPFFFTFGFMHCKNVQVAPQEITRQVRRQIERGKGVRYHVLDIEPMKRVLKTEGRQDEVGLKQAFHICRGHFKTYTEDSPLFGRYTGTWWWEAQARGDKTAGEVKKDYNVKLPAPDDTT